MTTTTRSTVADDRAARAAALAERRRTRILAAAAGIDPTQYTGPMAHRADRPLTDAATDAPDAISEAARTGGDRIRAAAIADARRRDEWHRRHAYRLDANELLRRCAIAAERATVRAPEVDADAITSDLAVMVAERHGWEPVAADVSPAWLERRGVGIVQRERERAGRRVSADALTGSTADDLDRDAGSVWAAATGRSYDPTRTRDALAADVAANTLADRMGIYNPDARMALRAALAGWGSGKALAAALGVSAAAARKRLQRGRESVRDVYPTAGKLADAVMGAQLAGDATEPDRARLDPAARIAQAVLDSAADTTGGRGVAWRQRREPRHDQSGTPGGEWPILRKCDPGSRPGSADPHRRAVTIRARLDRPGGGSEPVLPVGALRRNWRGWTRPASLPVPYPSVAYAGRSLPVVQPVPVAITTGPVPAASYRPASRGRMGQRQWWMGEQR